MERARNVAPGRRVPILALLSANAVSLVGNSVTAIAIPWFVLETTGSAAKMGLTAAAAALAGVLAGLFGGPIVDRLGHKRASVVADLASGVTVATVPLLHHTVGLGFWQLLALVFLGSFLDAPGTTARLSLVPDLARRAGMPMERANSASEGIGHLSLLLGPPLGGVLIAAFGTSNVLYLDAATFVVSAALVSLAVPAPQRKDDGAEATGGYLAELAEGLRFVRRDRLILSVIALAFVANFLFGPLMSVVMPFYANSVYGSAVDLGFVLAGFAGGALAGTFLYGSVGHRLPRRATLVATCFLLGLPFWVLAFTPSLPVTAAALAVTGLALGALNPLLWTVEQERTPEEMLGRVIGADVALSTAASPLGMVLAGYALEGYGLISALVGIAACWLVVGLISALNPAFREMGSASDRGV